MLPTQGPSYPGSLAPSASSPLVCTGVFKLGSKVMGDLPDPALSRTAGHPLLARGVIWSGKGVGDVGSRNELAASLLEIQALGGEV